ncbi:MAG TPA: hypothetical protein VKV73_32515 [Chloroflexota bacterium]|nr:hypothetical protein [Chloroflexota bacterium]
MANGSAQAPTLEKVALSGAQQAGLLGPPNGVKAERLMAAIRYGWAMEELVYRLAYWATPPASAADEQLPAAYNLYPPDLTHQRSAAEHVRELQAQFGADGPVFLDMPSTPARPNPPQSAADADASITALLKAFEADPQATVVDPAKSTPIAQGVRKWDDDVVDLIIDQPPEVLAAYELGKGLSRTLWDIDVCALPNPVPVNPVTAWQIALNTTRINDLRRRLTMVAPVLDGATAASVSASLGFWARAYNLGYLATPAPSPSAAPAAGPRWTTRLSTFFRGLLHRQPALPAAVPEVPPEKRIPSDPIGQQKVRNILKQQLDNWYDLLTGRRLLSTFPVTAVVTNLVSQFAQADFIVWRPLILTVGGVALAVVLIGVLIWAAMNGTAPAAATAGSGVAGGLTALLAVLAARGAGLVDRGSQAVSDLQARVGQIQSRVSGLMTSAENQPPQLSIQSLAGSVVANVVDQIRLEESKLAISDPLIQYVMGQDKTKGPEQIAKDFLSKILANDGQSNLDRLQSVLGGLYKQYKGLIPGAP